MTGPRWPGSKKGDGAPEQPTIEALEAVLEPGVLEELRMRAIVASIASSAAVVVLVILYALLPGHYPLAAAPYFALVGAAVLAVSSSTVVPWRRVVHRSDFVPILFAWSVTDIALVSASIAVSGGARSDLYLLYLAMSVFMAAVSYPRLVRAALMTLLMAAYVITLGALGWHVGTGTIFLRLGIIAVTALGANAMAGRSPEALLPRAGQPRVREPRRHVEPRCRTGTGSRIAGRGRGAGLGCGCRLRARVRGLQPLHVQRRQEDVSGGPSSGATGPVRERCSFLRARHGALRRARAQDRDRQRLQGPSRRRP